MKIDGTSMMKKYGITCDQKTFTTNKQFQCGKRRNALNYAKLDHSHFDVNLIVKVDGENTFTEKWIR